MKKSIMTVGQLTSILENIPNETPITTVFHSYYDSRDEALLTSVELVYDDSNLSLVLHTREVRPADEQAA